VHKSQARIKERGKIKIQPTWCSRQVQFSKASFITLPAFIQRAAYLCPLMNKKAKEGSLFQYAAGGQHEVPYRHINKSRQDIEFLPEASMSIKPSRRHEAPDRKASELNRG